jgi:Xaa-Pro aminopeptidase
MKIELRKVSPPEIQFPTECPAIPKDQYEQRLSDLFQRCQADWVVVYADREHYANLTYLLNFDPRFEEALLVMGAGGKRTLVLGNECMGYTSVLPFPVETALAQTLSLGGQKRDTAPQIKKVLQEIGISNSDQVAVIGWKYLQVEETDNPLTPAFLPAFFVDVLRAIVGQSGSVVDKTAVMMHPETGLRSINSAEQIAAFEWAARSCSASVFSILNGARPGMTEMQAMSLMNYAGQPMSMHPIFASGNSAVNGLRSPSYRCISEGDGVSTAVGFWGSLCCRAGLMLAQPDQAFFEQVVTPYYGAIATWYKTMRLGVPGDEVFQAVTRAFEGSGMQSALNPGHLTSLEEWTHSPIRPGSSEQIHSGMVFQVDIIPTPVPDGMMLNCEDTIAFADAALRSEIQKKFPEMWQRIQSRRTFMQEQLGLILAEETLPLSDAAAYLPPFWLANDLVCVVV